jgi:hypothetical protein
MIGHTHCSMADGVQAVGHFINGKVPYQRSRGCSMTELAIVKKIAEIHRLPLGKAFKVARRATVCHKCGKKAVTTYYCSDGEAQACDWCGWESAQI